MALIDCQKCGATISARLTECPYCQPEDEAASGGELGTASRLEGETGGALIRRLLGGAWIWGAFGVIALGFALLALRSSPEPESGANPERVAERLPERRDTAPEGVIVNEPAPIIARESQTESPEPTAPVDPAAQLREQAEQGDPQAQFDLAFSSYPDAARLRDYQESMKWFREAAQAGHVDAQKQLGWMHYEGQGVAPDEAEALRWYQMAADAGDEEARRAVFALTSTPVETIPTAAASEVADGADLAEAEAVNEDHESQPASAPPPVIIINEGDQYISVDRRPDPRERYVDYLAASGFFARTRQDSARRDFLERNRRRQAARHGNSRSGLREPIPPTVMEPRRSTIPRTTRGIAPITSGPRPLTRGVTPLTRGITPIRRGVTPLGGSRETEEELRRGF